MTAIVVCSRSWFRRIPKSPDFTFSGPNESFDHGLFSFPYQVNHLKPWTQCFSLAWNGPSIPLIFGLASAKAKIKAGKETIEPLPHASPLLSVMPTAPPLTGNCNHACKWVGNCHRIHSAIALPRGCTPPRSASQLGTLSRWI